MSPRHILVLRHGQTDANASGVLQGHRPTSLNELGRQQAERLAQRLVTATPPIEVLVSSDLPRALQTAQPIARALDLEIVVDPAWRERAFGELEGQTLGDLEIWRTASGTIDPPGGESSTDFRARVHAALSSVVERYADRACVAVVTHGGVVRSILHLLGSGRLPLAGLQEPPVVDPIANASILHITVDANGGWSTLRVNDDAHLQGMTTTLDAG
ncbi:MAG: histidine phosphatase family protein [Acidobacteriota bacterium]